MHTQFKLFLIISIGLFSLQISCNAELNGEPDATPRPMRPCHVTYDLEKEIEVFLYPEENECAWDIIGSDRCTPELKCKLINIPKTEDCDDAYLKIVDGIGGLQRFCGNIEGTKALKASKGGRDLYITYKGPERGVRCTAKCGHGKKARRILVSDVDRKEESGCVCGVQESNDRNRIVGGENAKKNEFPWQVAIVPVGTNGPICGASLINDRFVLTASHCSWFTRTPPENIEVLLHAYILDLTLMPDWKDVKLGQQGSIRGHGYNLDNRTDEDEGRIRLKVKKIITHPLFTDKYDYDVSLLRLEKKLDLKTIGMAPICLPKIGDRSTYKGSKAVVTGWGKPDEVGGSTTRILQKLTVPILSTPKCEAMMESSITPRMMCAGYKEGARDACMGDSGGPLIAKRKHIQQYFQVGVVSWGEGCARKNRPGIYTRLTDVNQWIRHHSREGEAVWCLDDIPEEKSKN